VGKQMHQTKVGGGGDCVERRLNCTMLIVAFVVDHVHAMLQTLIAEQPRIQMC
jgi:hypothetical protein